MVPEVKGSVRVFDTITPTSTNKEIRQFEQGGLVFQFAENQIFEGILKDVAFGPQNFGVSGEEARKIAREKLTW